MPIVMAAVGPVFVVCVLTWLGGKRVLIFATFVRVLMGRMMIGGMDNAASVLSAFT